MAYFLGIDGGNSKTHALVITEQGRVLGFGASGGSDFQRVGMEYARIAWTEAMIEALSQASLQRQDITLGCFCLAGADLPEDYAELDGIVSEIAEPMKVCVKNDSIAALRAGLFDNSFGVTVVLGAGFNAAGRGRDGQEITLPGLGYISGDYGGGRWIGRQIIRAVMRAWDGRGPATSLRQPVLEILGVQEELELVRCLRAQTCLDQLLDLVPILFDVAFQGDAVAQSLLTFVGKEVGISAAALIRRLDLENEEVPVVLSTSIFRGKGPLFIDVITETVHRTSPRARILTSDFAPVVGAAIEALNAAGQMCSSDLVDNLYRDLVRNYPDLVPNNFPFIA